jgi:hypothetical protein
VAYVIDPGGRRYAAPKPKKPAAPAFTGPVLPPDPWSYPITAHTPGVDSSVADPWMNTVPGLVNYPQPGDTTAPPTTPAAPGPPKYNLGTDPGVILSIHNRDLARTAAAHAHTIAYRRLLNSLAARGITRSSETTYQQGEDAYNYGNQSAQINNAPLQAYIAAWQYAQQHPELYSGIVGLPPELGG